MSASLEPEVRTVDCAVVQLHYQLSTSAGPGCVSFPDVDISISCRVVAEAAAAGGYSLSEITCGISRVAGYGS